jgi:hypothetical protein
MSPVKQIRNPITGAVVQVELAGETPTQREASALMRTFRLQAEQQVGRDLAAGIDPFGGGQQPQRAGVQQGDRVEASGGLGTTVRVDPTAGPPTAEERSAFLPRSAKDLEPSVLAIGQGVGMGLGALGGLASPLPGGALVGGMTGGVLGTAGAQTIYDAAVTGGRALGLVGEGGIIGDDPSVQGGIVGSTERAMNEAALEASTAILGPAAGLAKRGAARFVGKLGDEAKNLAFTSRKIGVSLGLEALSSRPNAQRFRRLFGQFPLLGTPLLKSDRKIAGQLVEAKDALLFSVAPYANTIVDAGLDIGRSTWRKTRAIRALFSSRYKQLFEQAAEEGALIPTTNIRKVAKTLVSEIKEGTAKKRVTKKIEPSGLVDELGSPIGATSEEAEVPIETISDPKIRKWAEENLTKLVDTMTPTQFQKLAQDLNSLIAGNLDNPDLLGQAKVLRKALEEDLDQLIGSKELTDSLRLINKNFRSFSRLLDRDTGKKIAKSTRGVKEIVELSEAETDDLFRAVFSRQSPQAMRDLSRLMPKTAFRRAVATHIEEAFDLAIREQTQAAGFLGAKGSPEFDLGVVRKHLGLGTGRKDTKARKALAAALNESGSGVSIKDWDEWFDVAEAQFRLGKIKVSDFIARRAQLGGLKSGIRTLTGASLAAGSGTGAASGATGFIAGGGVGSVLGLVGTIYAVRKFGKFLTDPEVLKLATDALSTKLPAATKKAAAVRFARLAFTNGLTRDDTSGQQPIVTPGGEQRPAREQPAGLGAARRMFIGR